MLYKKINLLIGFFFSSSLFATNGKVLQKIFNNRDIQQKIKILDDNNLKINFVQNKDLESALTFYKIDISGDKKSLSWPDNKPTTVPCHVLIEATEDHNLNGSPIQITSTKRICTMSAPRS